MKDSFENHIFISYGHFDNMPDDDGLGWVDHFHKKLFCFVISYWGKEELKIWRDKKLKGFESLEETIIKAVKSSAIFVAIQSPRYVKSTSCEKEIDTFYKNAQRHEVCILEKNRIFKVLKYPLYAGQPEPTIFQDLLGYKFYEINKSSENIEVFGPNLGQDRQEKFNLTISDLATQISARLHLLYSDNEVTQNSDTCFRGTIYLAETTSDLQEQYNRIRRELEQQKYRVLPDHTLPMNSDLRGNINQALQASQLSIHLVGQRYGVVPEEEDRSLMVLQHELALEYAEERPEFSRVVWLSPDGAELESRIQQFRDDLQSDPDLLQMGIEDLKSQIEIKLRAPKSQKASLPPMESQPVRIYLICDRNDIDEIAPVEDFLFDQGFEVLVPIFGDDAQEIRRQEHEEFLEMCDAVLIYYENGNERWQREQLQYLRKVPGLKNRTHPLWAKAILIRGPESRAKERLRTFEARVIKNFGEFDSNVLSPFLEDIAQGQRRGA